jgi:hypothetical protein
MKSALCLIVCALGFVGCGKNNAGRYGERETGTNSSVVVNAPAAHVESTNTASPPEKPVITAPLEHVIPLSTNSTAERENSKTQSVPDSANRQGNQVTPEPRTGDDANPDAQSPKQ